MKYNKLTTIAAIVFFTLIHSIAYPHGSVKNVKLHINPRWKECSFQLDPSLTQEAWHQFTHEAGLVVYFRPLTDAKPMSTGNYEFSILQWQTAFNDEDAAWNDTFVHPDSAHWLKEGERLGIPGLTFRTGVTDKIDAAAFWTKSPGANYGFWGGHVQFNVIHDTENDWDASVRAGFVSLYGPEDFDFTIYGIDLLASKDIELISDWVIVSPYAGISTYLSRSHETSAVVNLHDENIIGLQGMVGAAAHISFAKLAVEYNVAVVNSLSFKIGIGF